MYAVVKTGGKQYRVAKDDKLIIDRVHADAGEHIVLDQVLMMVDGEKVTFGAPTVSGAAVGATVLRQTHAPKVMVFRRKRRKNFRRTQGHHQGQTLIQIDDIAPDGKLKPKAKVAGAPVTEPKTAEGETQKKTVAKKTAGKKASSKKTMAKKA